MPRLVFWILLLGLSGLVGLTGMRAAAVWLLAQQGSTATDWWEVFFLGVRFDARVVAGILFPLLLAGAIGAANPFARPFARRFWLSYLTLAGVVLTVVYACDFLHLRYLNQRLNASVLGFLADVGISAKMVWQSYPVFRASLALVLSGLILAWAIRRSHAAAAKHKSETTRAASALWGLSLGGLLVFALFGRFGQYPLRWSDAFALRNDLQANLALNPVQSFLSSLSFRSSRYDQEKLALHRERVSQYLGVGEKVEGSTFFSRRLTAGGTGASPRPRNVVLIICESFSVYKSSVGGNPLDTTPFFAELCRQGVLFDNCFTPHFGTARGVWAVLTGVPDVELVKTATRNPALVDQHTLLNELEEHSKLYFLGGSSSWANVRGLLTNNIRGLQLFEEGSYRSPRADVWGISDKNLFLEANEILQKQTRPFFAVIQTANNHRPYTIPAEDRPFIGSRHVTEDELRKNGFESNEELDAFRYTDFAFKTFFEAARKSAYFDDTLFVMIGDHGIGGDAGPRFPASWTSKSLTSFHVPLLFFAPRFLAPRRVHSVSSMVDVLPTVVGTLGVKARYAGLGRDLFLREAVDGGRSNVAFIIDHNNKSIGVVRGSHYTHRRLNGTAFEVDWADPAVPVQPGGRAVTEIEDAVWAEAFFEASRYLLHSNKKPAVPSR
ncbi:MAG: LTA synthase family protein [Opitutaceae bacterium]|nr:LTA synthase family protein [Opitutaceae bacterium]